MGFRSTGVVLDNALSHMSITLSKLSNGNVRIDNYSEIVVAIDSVRRLGVIEAEIKDFEKSKINLYTQDSNGACEFTTTMFNRFANILATIRNEVRVSNMLIKKMLPNEAEHTLHVKLPISNTYKNVSESFVSINKIFELSFPEEKGNIKVNNFDNGSLLIDISVGSIIVLKTFGSLVKVATNLFVKIQQARLVSQQITELIGDSKERIEIKKKLDVQIEELISSQINEEKLATDKETEGKLTKSVKILNDLMDQGATFEPGIKSLNDMKETWPTLSEIAKLPITNGKLGQQEQIAHDKD